MSVAVHTAFGQVFLVQPSVGSKPVALKQQHKAVCIRSPCRMTAVKIERKVLHDVRGAPFLTQVICAFQSDTNFYFVMGRSNFYADV